MNEPTSHPPEGQRDTAPPVAIRGTHYQRPTLRLFLVSERPETTILFGTLTPWHEALIQAIFRGSGYLCQALPTSTGENCLTGKPSSSVKLFWRGP